MLGASQDVVVDVPLPLEEHIAHAGVVGLMARYALDLVNQKKGGSVEPPFRLVTRSYSGVTPWTVSIVFRGDRLLPIRQ